MSYAQGKVLRIDSTACRTLHLPNLTTSSRQSAHHNVNRHIFIWRTLLLQTRCVPRLQACRRLFAIAQMVGHKQLNNIESSTSSNTSMYFDYTCCGCAMHYVVTAAAALRSLAQTLLCTRLMCKRGEGGGV